tara:strand:- start:465 stop:641 length:177 start_codon:yes stop_codon:yes gene_type:complete
MNKKEIKQLVDDIDKGYKFFWKKRKMSPPTVSNKILFEHGAYFNQSFRGHRRLKVRRI